MAHASTDKDRFIRTYLATCTLVAGLLGLRLGYIAANGDPVLEALHLLPLGLPYLAVGSYFAFVRFRPTPAALFAGVGLAAVASFQALHASALVVRSGRHLPLADGTLAAADRAIGFDWPQVLCLFNAYPALDPLWQGAYQAFLLQPVVLVVALALTRQPERMFRLVAVTTVALTITQVVAMHFPALGPYEYFGITPGDHHNITLITAAKMTAGIQWLRAATLEAPAPAINVGLISFPSFHAASAVIFAWALWRTSWARWIGIGVNTLMLVATPVHGSHYAVDVVAGLAVGCASLPITAAMLRRLDTGWETVSAAWRTIPATCRRLLGHDVPAIPAVGARQRGENSWADQHLPRPRSDVQAPRRPRSGAATLVDA